ncbi:hypothetical protein [Blastopirellula marina]|uniref:Uncharacterized protein n=1 Tax=Blastopirellula marina TaxID=124 RepID=A0A2S8GP34_9BACT|nr:hypothetical protein [Blastopirellula marina]PQO46187.1 hypothetical protein C5Y93_09370 [Blastopirellula marina]
MDLLFLVADAKFDVRQLLDKNPMMLGGIFTALGAVAVITGILSLVIPRFGDQDGHTLDEQVRPFKALVRIVFGIGFMGYGLYRMALG